MSVSTWLVVAATLVQAPDGAAPDFTLPTLAGDSVTLSSLKGRPVFLNFWASWCKPCRGEMADIVRVQAAHAGDHLVVLAINLTDQEHMADVRQFVAEVLMPFPVLLDRRGRVRKKYRLRGVPSSVFIDAAGVVRFVVQGPIAPAAIDHGLSLILPRGEP